jgi:hypothetical protein
MRSSTCGKFVQYQTVRYVSSFVAVSSHMIRSTLKCLLNCASFVCSYDVYIREKYYYYFICLTVYSWNITFFYVSRLWAVVIIQLLLLLLLLVLARGDTECLGTLYILGDAEVLGEKATKRPSWSCVHVCNIPQRRTGRKFRLVAGTISQWESRVNLHW